MTVHSPVLLKEVIENMDIRPDGCYLDATWGRGGHSDAILMRLGKSGRLVVVDRDSEAVAIAKMRYQNDPRVRVLHCVFDQFDSFLDSSERFDAVLCDLGVCSSQIDEPMRGFSFRKDGPLDMRMDQLSKYTAAHWINGSDEKQMADVFFHLGDERQARAIAKGIVAHRKSKKILTTTELSKIVCDSKKRDGSKHHPATKVFLAIRLHINQEMESLKAWLIKVVSFLKHKGRGLIITFHSTEDRIVKRFVQYQGLFEKVPVLLRQEASEYCLNFIGGIVLPSVSEIAENPRARSAKLRVFEKLVKI